MPAPCAPLSTGRAFALALLCAGLACATLAAPSAAAAQHHRHRRRTRLPPRTPPLEGPRCSAPAPPVLVQLTRGAPLRALVALEHQRSLWLAALAPARASDASAGPARGRRRMDVLLARVRSDGTLGYGPRVVRTLALEGPSRRDEDSPPVALALTLPASADDEARPVVLLAYGRRAERIDPAASEDPPGADATREITPPDRALRATPLLATGAAGADDGAATVLFRRGGALFSVTVPYALRADEPLPPGAAHAMPAGTFAVSAARARDGALALIARTAARRYVLAFAREGQRAVRWTGLGPAGCEGRCPAVALEASATGLLARWALAPTEDRLARYGARALDDAGHPRGAPRTFVPMARGALVAGPRGEPLAVQLGHPSVLRGTHRPIALATLGSASAEARATAPRPALVASAARPDGALHVVLASPDGATLWHALRCEPPP